MSKVNKFLPFLTRSFAESFSGAILFCLLTQQSFAQEPTPGEEFQTRDWKTVTGESLKAARLTEFVDPIVLLEIADRKYRVNVADLSAPDRKYIFANEKTNPFTLAHGTLPGANGIVAITANPDSINVIGAGLVVEAGEKSMKVFWRLARSQRLDQRFENVPVSGIKVWINTSNGLEPVNATALESVPGNRGFLVTIPANSYLRVSVGVSDIKPVVGDIVRLAGPEMDRRSVARPLAFCFREFTGVIRKVLEDDKGQPIICEIECYEKQLPAIGSSNVIHAFAENGQVLGTCEVISNRRRGFEANVLRLTLLDSDELKTSHP